MGGRFGELLVILLIVLFLFGPGRIARVMKDLGKGIRAFRDGVDNKESGERENDNSADTPPKKNLE